MLADGACAACVVELCKEGAHIGGGAHHLVGGGEVGPTAEAEGRGDFLARGKELEEQIFVRGEGASVVGDEHALAQRGRGGEGHDGLHVGRVGGDGDFAFGVGGVARDVVGGEAFELVWGGLDGFAALLNVAAELEGSQGGLLVKGLELIPRFLVTVDAGEAVAEEGALDVVLRGGAGAGEVHGGESVIDRAVKAESAGRHGDALGFELGLVAHGAGGCDGVEDACLRTGEAELLNDDIVESEGVGRGTGAFHGEQSGERGFMRGEPGANPG